ncbi:putative Zinc finger, RING-type [Plasmopara halstedii]
MESKATDGSRTSVSKLKEGSWWRWSHGKSGLTASSSHFDSVDESNTILYSSSYSKPAASVSPSSGPRRQKRTTRTPKDDNVKSQSSIAWSTSLDPWSTSSSHFFSATSSVRSSRASIGSSKKKATTSSLFSRGSRDTISKKKALEVSSSSPSSSTFTFWTREDKRAALNETFGTMGKNKRSGNRKDRRNAKSASSMISSSRATRVIATRTPHILPHVNEDTEMRAPDANLSVFAISAPQSKPKRSSSPKIKYLRTDPSMVKGPMLDFEEDFPKSMKLTFPPSSPSAASTASTTSSFNSLSFPTVDPLVNCARAMFQDCIRNRQLGPGNARKRFIDDEDTMESKSYGWHCDAISKRKDHKIMSPRSSSSSDDELSQLSSMNHSFSAEKPDRDCNSKLAKEEMYRQILVGDYDLSSSSPEFQCLSPMVEEKGLPIEVRYQLPLALGTANETSKECTICQLRYGIGDHIVTLPCQHFFHACCVDKWLWNHTSCPLCRTEVILDQETEPHCTKHNFTECSPVDQERIRRQLRSSSQHAGFRPVVPVEIDQLDLEVSSMTLDEDLDVEDEPSYLICPTPLLATNALDDHQFGN